MKWFEKKKKSAAAGVPVVQMRQERGHPFSALEGYVPLQSGSVALYRSIREAVPIVDAAVWKLVRLCGGVEVKCADPSAQAGLERFWNTVDTGWGQRGMDSFLDRYLDDLFTCGQGLGEIVLDAEGREIAAVLCADPAQAEARVGESPLDFRLCRRTAG